MVVPRRSNYGPRVHTTTLSVRGGYADRYTQTTSLSSERWFKRLAVATRRGAFVP